MLPQEIYHSILNKVDHGFFVLNSNLEVIYWNKWFEDHLVTKGRKKHGAKLTDLFDVENRILIAIRRALELRKSTLLSQSFNPHPFPLYHNETQKILHRSSIQPLLAADQTVYCLINITDITTSFDRESFLRKEVAERKKAESELEKSLTQLRETQQQLVQSAKLASMGEMSAGIGHELNNPLFFIMGFNNRIRARFEKSTHVTYDQIKGYIDDINTNCQRIKSIITRIRDFSRQSEYKKDLCAINKVIENAFVLFSERLRLKEIKVNLLLDQSDPFVFVDPNRIEQVIFNLISNAADALDTSARPSGKMISVSSTLDHDRVVLVIGDNGQGISKENIGKIFDPFFTTKEVGKGTGLGLSISFSIIEEHGGKLEVKSEEGVGTEFKISLPAAAKPNQINLVS